MATEVAPLKQPSVFNIANAFTAIRIPLAVLGFFVFVERSPWGGAIIIAAAGSTDFFDGTVARAFNCATEFGKKFDPIVDKIFQCMVLGFTLFQVGLGARLGVLMGVAVVEVAIAVLTIYANGLGKTFDVTWAGKKGMFARMTCTTWMLAGTIGDSTGYTIVTAVAFAAGVVGVGLGIYAYTQYETQWKESSQRAIFQATVKK